MGGERVAVAVDAGGEVVQGHVERDLQWLPGPVGQEPGRGEPPAGFFQGVVVALGGGAGVFGACLLAQGVQDGAERGGALRGQVAPEFPGAAQGDIEPQAAVGEPVGVAVRAGQVAAHLLGQGGQAGQVSAARRGGEQDRVGGGAVVFGQQVGPVADLPRPRLRDRAVAQCVRDGGVRGQSAHRGDGGGRGGLGDPGLPGQPGTRRPVTVVLESPAGAERLQDAARARRWSPQRLLQAAQGVSLHLRGSRGQVRARPATAARPASSPQPRPPNPAQPQAPRSPPRRGQDWRV